MLSLNNIRHDFRMLLIGSITLILIASSNIASGAASIPPDEDNWTENNSVEWQPLFDVTITDEPDSIVGDFSIRCQVHSNWQGMKYSLNSPLDCSKREAWEIVFYAKHNNLSFPELSYLVLVSYTPWGIASHDIGTLLVPSWRQFRINIGDSEGWTEDGIDWSGVHEIRFMARDGGLDKEFFIDGLHFSTASTADITLPVSGWTNFGGHWSPNLQWMEDCKISNGEKILPISEAAGSGWIEKTIFYWDSFSDSYKQTPGDNIYLQAYHGYWLWSYVDNLILHIMR